MWIEVNLSEEEFNVLEDFYTTIASSPHFSDLTPILKKILSRTRYVSKTGRNSVILSMRKNGASYSQIAEKYKLSRSRVQQICEKQELIEKHRNNMISDRYSDFYACLLKASIQIGLPGTTVTRTYNCLYRAGILSEMEQNHKTLDDYTDSYLLSIRNFGFICLDLAREANVIYKNHQNKE